MIRADIVTDAGGIIAMLFPDDSEATYRRVMDLATAVHVPATVCIVPIPANVTGRLALYWHPKNEPPKEKPNDQSKTPTGD